MIYTLNKYRVQEKEGVAREYIIKHAGHANASMLIYSSFYMVPKRDRIPRILMDPIKFCPLQLQFGHGRKITREHRTSSNNSPWLALPLPVHMNNVTW
jgi:hypothetical protein